MPYLPNSRSCKAGVDGHLERDFHGCRTGTLCFVDVISGLSLTVKGFGVVEVKMNISFIY